MTVPLLWMLIATVLALFKECKTFLGIYESGFIYQRGGQDMLVVPWADVRAITRAATTVVVNGQERHAYVRVVLDSEQGQAIFNEEFPDIYEISEILDRKVCETLLPGAVAKLQAGDRIEFGAVSMDRAGIYRGIDNHLPWSRVGHVSFHAGKMRIVRKDTAKPWKKVPMTRVRNASLFAHLVDLAKNTAA